MDIHSAISKLKDAYANHPSTIEIKKAATAHLGFSESRDPNLRKGANQHETKKKRI